MAERQCGHSFFSALLLSDSLYFRIKKYDFSGTGSFGGHDISKRGVYDDVYVYGGYVSVWSVAHPSRRLSDEEISIRIRGRDRIVHIRAGNLSGIYLFCHRPFHFLYFFRCASGQADKKSAFEYGKGCGSIGSKRFFLYHAFQIDFSGYCEYGVCRSGGNGKDRIIRTSKGDCAVL